MTTVIEPHYNSTYSVEEIERGLLSLALTSGNAQQAVNQLKAAAGKDEKVPRVETLRKWRDRYQERYAEIRAEVLPKVKAQMADQHTDLAEQLARLETDTVLQLAGDLENDDLTVKDKIALIRNAAIAGAVHIDKAQLLRGEATQIVKRDLGEIARALASKGVSVEGFAVEVDEQGNEVQTTPALPAAP